MAGEPAFRPGDAAKVEARCGDAALDTRVKNVMSEALKVAGFRVAEGGWTLWVTASASDSGTKMTLGGSAIAVPEVKGTVELVAPDGTVTAKSTHRAIFPMGPGTKYYKKTEQPTIPGPNQGRTDLYQFGVRSPASAMSEEAWDRFVQTLPNSPWPPGAWRSGGRYVQLPLRIEVTPTAKGN